MKKLIFVLMMLSTTMLASCGSNSRIAEVKSSSLVMCSKYSIEQVLNVYNTTIPDVSEPVVWSETDSEVVANVLDVTYHFQLNADGFELTTIDTGVGLRPLSSFQRMCGQLSLYYYMHPDEAP